MSTALADFVEQLLATGNQDGRKSFFCDPIGHLDAFDAPRGAAEKLTTEERALIFNMDRIAILAEIDANSAVGDARMDQIAQTVMSYNFTDIVWDEVVCSNREAASAEIRRVLREMAMSSAGGGGGWTAPTPQISDVRPEQGDINDESFPIRIVGEGILPGALLILTNPYDDTYPPTYVVGELTIDHVDNFRTMHASTSLNLKKVKKAGDEYELCFLNPGSSTPVFWLDAFPVK
jgi:hypothetical protein